MGRAASVSIQNLVVGPIAMGSMRVSVNAEEMSESLLGMAFLNRLSSWRVDGDRLTLYP